MGDDVSQRLEDERLDAVLPKHVALTSVWRIGVVSVGGGARPVVVMTAELDPRVRGADPFVQARRVPQQSVQRVLAFGRALGGATSNARNLLVALEHLYWDRVGPFDRSSRVDAVVVGDVPLAGRLARLPLERGEEQHVALARREDGQVAVDELAHRQLRGHVAHERALDVHGDELPLLAARQRLALVARPDRDRRSAADDDERALPDEPGHVGRRRLHPVDLRRHRARRDARVEPGARTAVPSRRARRGARQPEAARAEEERQDQEQERQTHPRSLRSPTVEVESRGGGQLAVLRRPRRLGEGVDASARREPESATPGAMRGVLGGEARASPPSRSPPGAKRVSASGTRSPQGSRRRGRR